MRDIVLQYACGALLLLIVFLKLHDISALLFAAVPAAARFKPLFDRVAKIILSLFAVFLFIDPLFPGTALIEIHIESPMPMTRDHLAVRAVPVGPHGVAGGARTVVAAVGRASGVASIEVPIEWFESRVILDLLDESLASPVVKRKNIYLSPFVRRQLWTVLIDF